MASWHLNLAQPNGQLFLTDLPLTRRYQSKAPVNTIASGSPGTADIPTTSDTGPVSPDLRSDESDSEGFSSLTALGGDGNGDGDSHMESNHLLPTLRVQALPQQTWILRLGIKLA